MISKIKNENARNKNARRDVLRHLERCFEVEMKAIEKEASAPPAFSAPNAPPVPSMGFSSAPPAQSMGVFGASTFKSLVLMDANKIAQLVTSSSSNAAKTETNPPPTLCNVTTAEALTTSFPDAEVTQNIKSIQVPNSGQFVLVPRVFNVDAVAGNYIKSLAQHGAKTRISNSLDRTHKRSMQSVTEQIKSSNPNLESMKKVLVWMETVQYQSNTKKGAPMKEYTISANLISSKGLAYCQKAHTDFKTSDIKSVRRKQAAIPLSAFFGVCPNSSLLIWDAVGEVWQRIHYGVGDLILIAADVIHAGPTYKEDHWRIQFYLDTDIKHNPINPNEWLDWSFSNQPIKFEIDEGGIHTKDSLKNVNQKKLMDLYRMKLEDLDQFFPPQGSK
jgi:hypothetical protein